MDAATQVFIFLVCLFSGVIGGVVYDLLYAVKLLFPRKAVTIALDILFFCCFAAIYVFTATLFELPDVRWYMILGCLLGLLLYLKSIHRIVAFLLKKLYNRIGRCRMRR